jgi:signal transduction histidine kinase
VDRTPLVPLALVFVAASAIALSVARSAEELSLTAGKAGPARLSSANSAMFALGVGALVAALAAPLVDQLLRDLGQALAPAFEEFIFVLLLPLGYLAALVYALLEPILRRAGFFASAPPQAQPSDDELAMLREMERTRPLFIGGFEIVVAIVVILVALVLFERAVRERRLALPEGAQLERVSASGLTLGATLRSLFPRRPAARRAPREDGTPAAALRVIYWRLLALADRVGQGWRAPAETPSEHHRRISSADARWIAASPIVAAFEDLRYGELLPDDAAVLRAREALRAVEAAVRT